jgi:peptide/nickel transport system permease protein
VQRYVARRLILALPTIFGVALITFLLLNLVPGDVTLNYIAEGTGFNEAKLEEIRQELGLDDPMPVRFGSWLADVARGDLGESMLTRRSTFETFIDRAPVTLEIGVLSILLGLVIAIPAGTISAVFQNSPIDHISRLIATIGIAAPNFWLGTMVVVFLGIWFHYQAPPGFESPLTSPWVNFQQVIFPVLITGFRQSALTMRLTRTTMLEVLRQDYVRTARSKGLGELPVIRRHALRNALIPVVTVVGSQVAFVLGGTVIMETLFALPGVGQLTLDSILRRDYTQVQTNVLLLSIVVVAANLLTDLSYAVLDPRIRYE